MNQNELTGFVISRKNINDADKILTLFTLEQGRYSLIAKGVRKPKAKLQSAIEPLVETKFRALGKGKLPTIVGAKALDKNMFFGTTIESNLSALLLTEVVDFFSVENLPNESAYSNYRAALQKLAQNNKTSLVLNYYLLNLLKAYGVEPHIKPGLTKYWLDYADGTVLDRAGNNSVLVDINVVKLWHACLEKNSKLIEKLGVDSLTLADSLNLLISYIQQQTERKIKSSKVLSESTNLLQAN
jgi:DNA repair protein RecO (recombination protein O)